MSVKNLDKVFYRAAGAALTSLPSISGTYPTATVAGWIPVPGAIAEKAKFGMDKDVESPMGDGTTMISGEKGIVEVTIKDYSVTNYAAIRSAFLNEKVDIMAFDNEQRTVAYVVQGVILAPKIDTVSGEEPMIVLSGEKKAGAGITNSPFKPLGT
jgi:hypothetical protein